MDRRVSCLEACRFLGLTANKDSLTPQLIAPNATRIYPFFISRKVKRAGYVILCNHAHSGLLWINIRVVPVYEKPGCKFSVIYVVVLWLVVPITRRIINIFITWTQRSALYQWPSFKQFCQVCVGLCLYEFLD